jgi:hypothetical protein
VLLLLVPILLVQSVVPGVGDESNSILTHGSGLATIDCPDGSSVETDVAFVAMYYINGTILGNWTLDNVNSFSSSANGFSEGLIYSGNLYTGRFNLQGETYNSQEHINLCDLAIFAPELK